MARDTENGGSIFAPILISVLVAAAISAGGFGVGFGTGVFMHMIADEPVYSSEQLSADITQSEKAVEQGSSFGPNIKVENGTVTWISDELLAYLYNTGVDTSQLNDITSKSETK